MEGDNWMDIRADYKKGLSYTEIGKKYDIDPRTARKYSEAQKKPKYPENTNRKSKLEAYRHAIDELLNEASYSAVRIQEIIEEQGFDGKYTIVKDYVRSKKADLNRQATVRFETIPGLQGQVDWAHFPNHRIYEDNKYKKLYCFLMILGYSRNRYIEFVTDMNTDTLLRCHINAFRYLKGYPDEILYDNMKQVVVKRLIKQSESTLNPQFEDFAGFYGFKPVLCRPYRGQTKGKIERTVSFVRNNLMVGIKYDNLNDLNLQALLWCKKVNSKVHGTTNKIPLQELEKENLNPLIREFMLDKVCFRKIGKDCLMSYRGNKYSVPSKYAGKEGFLRVTGSILTIYHQNEMIAHHKLDFGKNNMNVNPEHYRDLIKKQSFSVENTIFNNPDVIHSCLPEIDLSIYDEEAYGE